MQLLVSFALIAFHSEHAFDSDEQGVIERFESGRNFFCIKSTRW